MKLLRLRSTDLNKAKYAQERGRSRGQSMVEISLILPLIVLLLAVVVEAGLALNSWMRVNTAARDSMRFALDAGHDDEVAALAMSKLPGMNSGDIDIYLIKGSTDCNGNIPPVSPPGPACSGTIPTYWGPKHIHGTGPSEPKLTRATLQQRLNVDYRDSNAKKNVPFTIVEIQYKYTPLALGVFLGRTTIPMTSYAIVQQY
jgi:hypothetical protein